MGTLKPGWRSRRGVVEVRKLEPVLSGSSRFMLSTVRCFLFLSRAYATSSVNLISCMRKGRDDPSVNRHHLLHLLLRPRTHTASSSVTPTGLSHPL
jgi:hypothetical protein